jgi:hypothetical protein
MEHETQDTASSRRSIGVRIRVKESTANNAWLARDNRSHPMNIAYFSPVARVPRAAQIYKPEG